MADSYQQTKLDQELIAGLRRGEKAYVDLWFATYQDKLQKYILTKIANEKDVEELVQETFMNCLRHLPLFRGDSSVWTWMSGIARHEVADYYRKKYAKQAIKTLPIGELILASKLDDAHETAELVRSVLAKMSQQSVELLLAKYVDGKKVKQIALEWGRSVKAIESDLFRAREEFRTYWYSFS